MLKAIMGSFIGTSLTKMNFNLNMDKYSHAQ